MQFNSTSTEAQPQDQQVDEFAEYLLAKADADRAQRRLTIAEQALKDLMAATHAKTLTLDTGDIKHRVTYVTRETHKIDEKGLRKALRARVFDRFTERRLVRSRLEAAMASGEVDPMLVSKYVETVQSAPYLRYTEAAE
jgi:prolyl-tRNA editing enzyme YbaK/EbsC (Cys-tRNA(Pro) deacylase)